MGCHSLLQGYLPDPGIEPLSPALQASEVALVVKEPICRCRRHKRCGFNPCVREDPLEEGMETHSSILAWRVPWKSSLAGYSPWGRKELDTTEAA